MAFAHRTVSPLAPELVTLAQRANRAAAAACLPVLEGLEVTELSWDEWLAAGGERRVRGQAVQNCRRGLAS